MVPPRITCLHKACWESMFEVLRPCLKTPSPCDFNWTIVGSTVANNQLVVLSVVMCGPLGPYFVECQAWPFSEFLVEKPHTSWAKNQQASQNLACFHTWLGRAFSRKISTLPSLYSWQPYHPKSMPLISARKREKMTSAAASTRTSLL